MVQRVACGRRHLLLAMGFAGLASSPAPAAASCEAATRLADLHRAYGDMVEGTSRPRADIGRHIVSRDLPGGDTSTIIDELSRNGFANDIARIARVLEDMAALAMTAGETGDPGRHAANRAMLADILRATDCFEPEADPSDDGAGPGAARPAPGAERGPPGQPAALGAATPIARFGRFVRAHPSGAATGAAASLAAIGLAGLALYRRVRVMQARAYPRYTLGRSMTVRSSSGRPHDLAVIDISRGGLKLARPEGCAAEDFARATVDLDGTITALTCHWENAHFLGMAFDQPLTEDRLREILELSPDATT